MRVRDILILDFDGTIAVNDIGDTLCERFADPRWREYDRAWERRELSLDEAQRRMWALFEASADELHRYLSEVGHLREGFDELLGAARRAGVGVVVASGGFDYYIERLLGSRVDQVEAIYTNRMEVRGRSVEVAFPLKDELGCDGCAVCKGRVCDRYRAAGYRVTFAGDGSSDRCAVGRADRLFAVRGSKLAARCRSLGAEFDPFDDFHDMRHALWGPAARSSESAK